MIHQILNDVQQELLKVCSDECVSVQCLLMTILCVLWFACEILHCVQYFILFCWKILRTEVKGSMSISDSVQMLLDCLLMIWRQFLWSHSSLWVLWSWCFSSTSLACHRCEVTRSLLRDRCSDQKNIWRQCLILHQYFSQDTDFFLYLLKLSLL